MTPVFAATPAIFTKTAIEAVIQDQGFAAQTSIAAILRGTPLLVALGGVAWSYVAYRTIVAMTVEGQPAPSAMYRLAVATFTMALGWTLLGVQTGDGIPSSPVDANDAEQRWTDLPGVAANSRYERLRDPSEALWGFGTINGAFEVVSAVLTGAVGVTPEEDPAEMVRSMVRLQATTLGAQNGGEEVLAAFDSLARNCGRSDARVLTQGAPIKALFATTLTDIGTDATGDQVDCAQLWTDFEEATAAVAARLYLDQDNGPSELVSRYGWQRFLDLGAEWYGLDDDEVEQWGTNALIEGTLRDAARRSAGGINPLRKDEATFSEGWPDYIVDVLVDGAIGELALNAGSVFDPNIHLRAQKAEAAKRFNEIADLIPTMRGFLHAAFAVAFPLCAYAVALGWTVPMRNWLVGRAVLALYMPAAHLLYAMVAEFAGYNALADNPEYAWLHSQQAVVGALAVMEAETLRVQTAYLICEVAVFTSFAIGSARALLLGGFGSAGSGASSFVSGVSAVVGTVMLQRSLIGGAAIAAGARGGSTSAGEGGARGPIPPAVAPITRTVTTPMVGTRRHAVLRPLAGAARRQF